MPQTPSKEEIWTRMLEKSLQQDAARLWGMPTSQIKDLDPVVKMLFGGLASELYQIHEEVSDSHTRVLNRLAQLLTPEILVAPSPAHAIVHGNPTDAETTIDTHLQLIGSRIQRPNERIYFSPAQKTTLKDVRVTYIAYGSHLYQRLEKNEQQSISEGIRALPNNTLWVALDAHPDLTDLRQLSFYFHWQDINRPEVLEQYYYRLSMSRWYIQGRALAVDYGYYYHPELDHLAQAFDTTARLEQEAAALYQKGFVTLAGWQEGPQTSLDPQSSQEVFPGILESYFPDIAEVVDKPCIWLRVEFPDSADIGYLDRLVVATNCFPVLNRRLHKMTHWLSAQTNIIPLETEQHFLDVKAVHNTEDEAFLPVPFNPEVPQLSPQTYSLRWGGTGRYDSRNAADLLAYLLELLRDESAAFKALGYDVLETDIDELNRILNRIELRISTQNLKAESVPYLVIQAKEPNENIFIYFWSTHAHAANDLRQGADLQLTGNAVVSNADLFLVTKPRNGKTRSGEMQKLTAYRQALLSRERIVTEADIRLACKAWLGDLIESVSIKPILVPANYGHQGLVRKIGVSLIAAATADSMKHDWTFTCQDIEAMLTQRSSILNGFKVQVVLPEKPTYV